MDGQRGLSAAEVSQRLQTYGPNALAEAKPVPVWQRFLKQYKEYMQIVLVGAAIVSLLIHEYVTGVADPADPVQRLVGLPPGGQGRRGRRALEDEAVAKVRRDGEVVEVPADQIVPGDVVLVDAGDRVPGGRAGDRGGHPAGRGRRPDR